MLPFPPYGSPDFPATLIFLLVLVGSLAFLAVVLIPYWFIFKKAGFPPWLSLLMTLPLVNLIILYLVAFTPWSVAPIAAPALPPSPQSPLGHGAPGDGPNADPGTRMR